MSEIDITDLNPNCYDLLNNKYFITRLVAHFAATRMVTIEYAAECLSKSAVLKAVFDEYIKILAGENLYIESPTDQKNYSKTSSNISQLSIGSPVFSEEDVIKALNSLINKNDENTTNITEDNPLEQKVKRKKVIDPSSVYTHKDIMV